MSKKPNILYIHDRPSGGAGESLYQMIFDNKLWNTRAVVFLNSGFLKDKYDQLKPAISSHYVNGVSWLATVKNKSWLFWPSKIYYYSKTKALKNAINNIVQDDQIDVIHTNTINIIEGGKVARKNKIPHFVQVRELLDLDYYQYPISKKWIINNLHKYSSVVIANSNRTKEGLIKMGAQEDKIKVVYNTVSATSEKLDIRTKLNLDPHTKVVALVGWITPNKKVEDFIDVAMNFSRRPGVKFIIIGGLGSVSSYNNMIKQKLKKSTNVVHAGLIPNATSYMSSFDVLLCTCYTESFGRTVAEALIVGTPAIGVKSCAVAELIVHEKSGYLVETSDIDAFAKYTDKLLQDQELNKSMGAYGIQDCQKRFGLETIRQQYLTLYQEYITKYKNE